MFSKNKDSEPSGLESSFFSFFNFYNVQLNLQLLCYNETAHFIMGKNQSLLYRTIHHQLSCLVQNKENTSVECHIKRESQPP